MGLRLNRIEELGLGSETERLYIDEGKSLFEVRDELRKQTNNLYNGKPISHVAVERYLKKKIGSNYRKLRYFKFEDNIEKKICKRCQTFKSLDNFKITKSTNSFMSNCVDCVKIIHNRYNKDKLKGRTKEVRSWLGNLKNIDRRRVHEFIFGFKNIFRSEGFCIICGELDPFVFEQHHIIINPGQTFTLCSNDHRRYTLSGNYGKLHKKLISKAIKNGVMFR